MQCLESVRTRACVCVCMGGCTNMSVWTHVSVRVCVCVCKNDLTSSIYFSNIKVNVCAHVWSFIWQFRIEVHAASVTLGDCLDLLGEYISVPANFLSRKKKKLTSGLWYFHINLLKASCIFLYRSSSFHSRVLFFIMTEWVNHFLSGFLQTSPTEEGGTMEVTIRRTRTWWTITSH